MLEIFVRNPVVQVSIIKFHVQWMTLQCLKNDDPQMVRNAQGLTCATLSTFGAILFLLQNDATWKLGFYSYAASLPECTLWFPT